MNVGLEDCQEVAGVGCLDIGVAERIGGHSCRHRHQDYPFLAYAPELESVRATLALDH